MARSRIPDGDGDAAVAAALTGGDRAALATAVRYLLQLLAERHPGGSVEVRVPPFGAVQCVEGPKHTRGTPPNVVEMDPAVWLAVATGGRRWDEAREAGEVRASGSRADLTGRVPVWRAPVRR
jgi:hypothetical protein